jgi:hypothetical protein
VCLYPEGGVLIFKGVCPYHYPKKTSSNKKNNDKQIFEKTIDAFFANNLDRKSAEEYIFKLFDDMMN